MMSDPNSDDGWSIDRRTLLRSTAAASAAGVVGLPAFSGSAFAGEGDVSIACDLDVMCAVDASGSLDGDDLTLIEEGVNEFIDELGAGSGNIRVGSLQFAEGEITRLNGLQAPGELMVEVDEPGGDTPMPAALDIADQILYNDPGQRDDADKLIVMFTDGGPNYETQYNGDLVYEASTYTAPRDDTTTWSATTDPGYDNPDGGTGNVSKGEMEETAGVATSIKGTAGDGQTQIAAIYVDLANDVTNAMTSAAETTYTNLPTYLENYIASSSELFLRGETAEEIANLGTQLAETLEANCCAECPEGLYYKYEWVEDEEAEGDCAGEFVVYDSDDNEVESVEGLELVSVQCDEAGEPMEACFETDYCGVDAVVKAGPEYEVSTLGSDAESSCVTGIEGENPGGETVTYAISNIRFYCEAPDDLSVGDSGGGGPTREAPTADGGDDHDRGHGNNPGVDTDNPGRGNPDSRPAGGRGNP